MRSNAIAWTSNEISKPEGKFKQRPSKLYKLYAANKMYVSHFFSSRNPKLTANSTFLLGQTFLSVVSKL